MRLIGADRVDENTVKVNYTISGQFFSVEWSNLHPVDGSEIEYDLQTSVSSDDARLSDRIEEAIRAGEDDSNEDCYIYLFIRDTFNKADCEDLKDSVHKSLAG